MLLMQLISIELIIGIAAIGAVSAWKKSLGERLCLLGTIPVSFALAFGLTKLGIWNFFGNATAKKGLISCGRENPMAFPEAWCEVWGCSRATMRTSGSRSHCFREIRSHGEF